MKRSVLSNRRTDRGTSILELAIASPVLLLLLLGAADFGRVFYHAVALANAAGTGAFYGAQSTMKSGQFDVIKQVTRNDAKDLGAIDVTVDRFCDCPDGNKVDCITGVCSGYGAPRVYLGAKASEKFRTLASYSRVPSGMTVGRKLYIRVQ